MDMNIPKENYATVLKILANNISTMCDKGLQVNPGMIVVDTLGNTFSRNMSRHYESLL